MAWELSRRGNPSLARNSILRQGILSNNGFSRFPAVDADAFKKVNADVADMEGAAIAWLAQMFGLPFYSIKGVTDLMDEDMVVVNSFKKTSCDVVNKIAIAAQALIDELMNPLDK